MKKSIFLFAFLFLGSISMNAQKYGYLNFGNLIAMMPETEGANKALEVFQDSLVSEGQKMAAAFEADASKFVEDVQGGTVPPVEQQNRQAALEKRQEELRQYEGVMVQMVQQKRQELLAPIVEKADKAIAVIAEEQGFTMIFDTSSFNAVLYGDDSNDVMPIIKAKLGLTDE